MQAVVFSEFGDPDVLRIVELPQPEVTAGSVLVKVAASTVNPTDTLMRSGKQAALMTALAPPFICGVEFAGHVHDVGAGVAALTAGQPVMGIVNPRRPEGGAHAQFIVVPAASVVPVSAAADLALAATVPMNGMTAKLCLSALELSRGDSVLVTGGAGALGGYVIQLARHAGLEVIADAGEADVPLLRSLGAGTIVPRGAAMAGAVRARFPQGVGGLVDGALLGDAAAALVRDGGVAVSLRRTNPVTDARLRARYIAVFEHVSDTAALADLAARMQEGALTPRVALRLPMSEAAEAHRRVEQGGLRGRVVLMF